MFTKVAIGVTGAGLLFALAGSLWHLLLPTPDANIGAGILVLFGLPIAGVGLLLVVISVLLDRRARR